MHTVQTGYAMLFQKLRRLHVGSNHAFFNQAMRIIARHDFDLVNLAIVVEFELGLRQIDLDGTAPSTRLAKCSIEPVKFAN